MGVVFIPSDGVCVVMQLPLTRHQAPARLLLAEGEAGGLEGGGVGAACMQEGCPPPRAPRGLRSGTRKTNSTSGILSQASL